MTQVASKPTLSVERIDSTEAFWALRADWDALLGKMTRPTVFITFEWLWAWWKSFGEGRPAVYVVRSEAEVVGIIPLLARPDRRCGIPFVKLQSMTNYHTPKYDFIVAADRVDDVIAAFLDQLANDSAWQVLELAYVPQFSPIPDVLERCCGRRGLRIRRVRHAASPYVAVDGDFETYFQGLSKSFRNNTRYAERKLEQAGGVELEEIREAAGSERDLREAFEIEARSWKGDEQTAILNAAGTLGFYTDLAALQAERGRWMLYFLKVGGKRVAFDFCLRYRDTVSLVKIGYDPSEHSKYSPGTVIRKKVLERLFADGGVRTYDMLGTATDWKLKWTDQVMPTERVFVYPRRFISTLLYEIDFGIPEVVKSIRPLRKLLGRAPEAPR